MVTPGRMEGLSLIGGRPALDFTNTEGGRRNGPPERLDGYGDLVAWSLRAGVLERDVARRLDARAGRRPDEARDVHRRAIELREALYRIVAASISGSPPSDPDMAILERELQEAVTHRHLVPDGAGGFTWRMEDTEDLERPLWAIALDAADLLSSETLARVKECHSDTCAWLFLDESRNRSRRWCDMGDCGNRAKARRYRRRHRE